MDYPSVNDGRRRKEGRDYQIQVNTLEDKDNPIRAIFAVQKLNEGWDVLNLFDRQFEDQDGFLSTRFTASEEKA